MRSSLIIKVAEKGGEALLIELEYRFVGAFNF